MGYQGGSLKGFVSAAVEVTPLAAFAMADAGADYLLRQARDYTPIGPGRDGGHVYTAWEKVEVDRTRVGGYVAYQGGALNRHYRVGWLEYGTAPRVIEPDDQEAITTPEGPRAAAHHPGTPARHMMGRAAHDLDVHGDEVLADELREWATAAEANARRRPGIR